jgi:anti-sigma factor RsiW
MMSAISAMRAMLTCRWSARRIQRYLDSDPSAPLGDDEVRRLEAHLAACERCRAAVEEFGGIQRALARWSQRRAPDPAAVARLRRTAERLVPRDSR